MQQNCNTILIIFIFRFKLHTYRQYEQLRRDGVAKQIAN